MSNAPHENAPVPLSPTYRALKFLAVAMGVVLLGGLVVVFGFMAKQLKMDSNNGSCDPTTIAVAGNNELMKIEEKDDMITLWVRDETGAVALRRYTMCGGDIVRDVRISGGRPPLPPQGMSQGVPPQAGPDGAPSPMPPMPPR